MNNLKNNLDDFNKKWLNDLKIAIINNDEINAINLLDNVPKFDNSNDLIIARSLVGEVIAMLQEAKNVITNDMTRIKQIKNFLE